MFGVFKKEGKMKGKEGGRGGEREEENLVKIKTFPYK